VFAFGRGDAALRLSFWIYPKAILAVLATMGTRKQTNVVFAFGRGDAALRLSFWIYPKAILAVLASTMDWQNFIFLIIYIL